MVDSSIGGKTGVNTSGGKNLIGTFYRPVRIYTDPSLLSTLPTREFANGMAEIIKAGAIYDANLFQLLEERSDEVCVYISMVDILNHLQLTSFFNS